MVNELNDIGLNVKLGKYHHTAGSFHVYERHYTMMNNISSQYDTRQNSMGKKFSLKGNVTYQYMKENGLIIPNQDMEKSQIKELVEMCKDKIYVK
jgi:thymidylate synthase